MPPTGTKKKADLKIVILGSASVGKTCLIHRYIERKFEETVSTIGASFSLKQWGSYNVAIWDTAGEERFSGLSSFYCRGAGAAILSFDLTCEDSFHSLRARFIPLLEAADPECVAVLVGCKADLLGKEPRAINQEDAFTLATEVKKQTMEGIPYFETSSISGQNVDRVFDYILNHCLPLEQGSEPLVKKKNSSVVDLNQPTDKVETKSRCC